MPRHVAHGLADIVGGLAWAVWASANVLNSGIGKLLYEPASVVGPVGLHAATATALAPTGVVA